MNKIYKLVWSKVRNTWVVASEIAKGHGKSSSRRKKTMVALMVFSLLSAGGLSYAATLTADQQAVYDAVLQKLETEKKTVHYFSVNGVKTGAGSNYNNDGATGLNSLVIGGKAIAQGENSMALGYIAQAQGVNSVAVGYVAKAGGVASAALGSGAEAQGIWSTALGVVAKAQGEESTALGHSAQAGGAQSVALGNKAQAQGRYSTALGSQAKAEGAKSAAFGTEAHAKGDTSIAAGMKAESIGKSSMALGIRTKAQADGSIAMGMMAESRQNGSVALGAGSLADRNADVWGLDISTGQAMNEDTLLGAGKADYEAAKAKLTELEGQAQTLMGQYQASLAQDPIGLNGYPEESAATQAIKSKLDAKRGEVFAKTMEVKNAVKTWSATEGAISVGNTERAITRQITGVAAGTDDTDAVNVAQLKKVAAMAKSATVDIEAGDNVTVNKDANTGKYKISAKDTTLKPETNALSLSNGTLKLSIEDTKGTKVTGSVDLKTLQSAVDTNTTYTMKGTENKDNTTTISITDSNGEEQKVTVATKDTRNTIVESDTVAVDDTNKNADGSTEYKLNVKTDGKVEKDNKGIVTGGTVYNETRIEKDGNYIKKNNTAGENLNALDKQVGINTGNIKKNKEDINALGKKVDINTGNINKNTETINILGKQVGNLDTRINRVGAGAAALAGLHPLDYDPDNKFDVAAGYGNYKGANALAIGAFYRPDENKIISIGGSFGGGENMVSAGVSVKLGQGTGISTSKVAMAKEIKNLKIENERMQEENREMKQEIEVLKEQMQKLLAGK